MKFVLFVEGHTEKQALANLLKRWLDPRLDNPIGIQVVRFDGWSDLVKETPKKARMYLNREDIIGVIALLDLYGPTIYPDGKTTAGARYTGPNLQLPALKRSTLRKVLSINTKEF
ncbi:MAG: hypothetical protein JRH15_15000 [Deltaproteobacteria bacterium]|nr:hypothetical protein [Deltaproteobacteria bacterium]